MRTEDITVGQKVEWKKQGVWGSYDAEVISIGDRIRIKIYAWMGIAKDPFFVNVKAKSLSAKKKCTCVCHTLPEGSVKHVKPCCINGYK